MHPRTFLANASNHVFALVAWVALGFLSQTTSAAATEFRVIDDFNYSSLANDQTYWTRYADIPGNNPFVFNGNLVLRARDTAFASAAVTSPLDFDFFTTGFTLTLNGFSHTTSNLAAQDAYFRIALTSQDRRQFLADDAITLRIHPAHVRFGFKLDQPNVDGEFRAGTSTEESFVQDFPYTGTISRVELSVNRIGEHNGVSVISYRIALDGTFGASTRITRHGTFRIPTERWGTDESERRSALTLESRRSHPSAGGNDSWTRVDIGSVTYTPLLPMPPLPEGPRLRDLAERRGLLIGVALRDQLNGAAMGHMAYDSFATVAGREFNIFTPENQHKFQFVHPTPFHFTFAAADVYDQFARDHNGLLRGHPMVWYKPNNLPSFVLQETNREALIAIQDAHIAALGARWGERMHVWDVANEIFSDNIPANITDWRDALRPPGEDHFHDHIGPDYAELAFLKAAEVRDAHGLSYELIYNDYWNHTISARSNAQYLMLQDFVARGIPVDGVGFQMHLGQNEPNYAQMRDNFKRLSDLGLSLHITELDTITASGDAGLERQARIYHNVLDVALRNPHFTVFQTWGLSDRYSHMESALRPLPFNDPATGHAFAPKPAYYAIQDALLYEQRSPAILNGGFEAGLEHWTTYGNPNLSLTIATDHPHSGNQALAVGKRNRAFEGPAQNVRTRLLANDAGAGRYQLAGWFRVPSGPTQVRLTLRLNDSTGVIRYLNVDGVAGPEWTRISDWIHVTWFKELTEATVYAETPGSTVDFFLDDVSLGDGNLLQNGTMEAGTAPWTALGGFTLSSNTSESGRRYGTRGLRAENRSLPWNGPSQSIRTALEANGPGRYQLSGYMRSDLPGEIGKLTVRLTYDGRNVFRNVQRELSDTRWTRLSGEIQLDWDQPLTNAIFYAETDTGTEPFGLDHVFLRKIETTGGELPLHPYDAWIAATFSPEQLADPATVAPTADPDGDGLPNLLEYALNRDPRIPDSAPPVHFSRQNGSWEVSHLRFSNPTAAGITYHLETSTDLIDWAPLETPEVEIDPVENGWETVRVRTPATGSSDHPRRFFRLRVEKQ